MTEFYAGQIAYQDLLEPKTFKVASGVANIARGDLCTMNSDGYLKPADPVNTGPAVFKDGLFVALQKADSHATIDGHTTCQVACVRSRVVMEVGVVTIGMPVKTANNSYTRLVGVGASPAANTVIGTVYEFPGAPDKRKSAAGDLAVIDLGIGV